MIVVAALYGVVAALALASSSSTAPLSSAGERAWPVAGAYRLTSPFGWRKDPLNRARDQFHRGVDLAASQGTPVVAPITGRIVRVNTAKVYGLAVWVQAGDELHLLAHLSRADVVVGDQVQAGDQVGAVGCTGTRCTGPHLHWQVTQGQQLVDPLTLMEG